MRVEDQPAGGKWIRMTKGEVSTEREWAHKGGRGLIKMMVLATAKASLLQPFATSSFLHKPLSHVHSYPGSLSRRLVCEHKLQLALYLVCPVVSSLDNDTSGGIEHTEDAFSSLVNAAFMSCNSNRQRDMETALKLEYIPQFCKTSAEYLPALCVVHPYGSSTRCCTHHQDCCGGCVEKALKKTDAVFKN